MEGAIVEGFATCELKPGRTGAFGEESLAGANRQGKHERVQLVHQAVGAFEAAGTAGRDHRGARVSTSERDRAGVWEWYKTKPAVDPRSLVSAQRASSGVSVDQKIGS